MPFLLAERDRFIVRQLARQEEIELKIIKHRPDLANKDYYHDKEVYVQPAFIRDWIKPENAYPIM